MLFEPQLSVASKLLMVTHVAIVFVRCEAVPDRIMITEVGAGRCFCS